MRDSWRWYDSGAEKIYVAFLMIALTTTTKNAVLSWYATI